MLSVIEESHERRGNCSAFFRVRLGTRMKVRFFGGWDFKPTLQRDPRWVKAAWPTRIIESTQQCLSNIRCDGRSQFGHLAKGARPVDTETVDRQFSALQQQAQQTATLIQTLAGKLSTAAAAADPNAREWALDLKEIALAIRDEQSTTTELLQGDSRAG